jgi:hypothetical protein
MLSRTYGPIRKHEMEKKNHLYFLQNLLLIFLFDRYWLHLFICRPPSTKFLFVLLLKRAFLDLT